MRGVFGGELLERDGDSVERVAPEVARTLRDAAPRVELPALPDSLAGVELVTAELVEDDLVRFSSSLAGARPLGALAHERSAALEALARAASAIGALHVADAFDGDLGLGSDAIRVREDGRVAVVLPARRPPAGALLAARLRAGAPATAAAFSAPEVVTGYEAAGASDVFALAALAHEIVTGRAPLGQIDFSDAQSGPFARLAPVVARGLAANPVARPSADALASALREAAGVAHDLEQPGQTGPYRGGSKGAKATPKAQSPAEATARKQAASSMSGILLLLLIVGGLFVFTGALWLVGVTWSALDGPGRCFLLVSLTASILVAGVALAKKGYAGSARALIVLGVELLWADGAYLLDVSKLMDSPGAWSALAAALTALAFVLAGALESLLFGVLAALHYVVFAVAFGAYLHTGAPTGPATYALALALSAAGIAFGGHKWRGELLGMPFAAFACLSALGSAIAGLVLLGESAHRDFGAAWPYGVAAVATIFALGLSGAPQSSAGRGRYGALGALVVGVLLAFVPSSEAFVREHEFGYLLIAVAIGFAVLGAAFTWPRLSRDSGVQAAWVVVGLMSAIPAPSLLFLAKCWDMDGLTALTGDKGVYLLLVLGTSAALVVASYALAARARNKLVYRMLEIAGLLQVFGTFTLESLVRSKDAFYPIAVLALGAACFAVGAATKRASLVLLASAALLLNLSIQYFTKLWDVLPASLLVLVFGLFLLAGGVFYERRIKRLLPELREWA
jgi:hypothetical protein